jgi:hypothetical protein
MHQYPDDSPASQGAHFHSTTHMVDTSTRRRTFAHPQLRSARAVVWYSDTVRGRVDRVARSLDRHRCGVSVSTWGGRNDEAQL